MMKFRSKLDVLVLLIVLTVLPATTSTMKIKWFAYCYFDLIDTMSSLTCGKCTEEVIDRIRLARDDLGGGANDTDSGDDPSISLPPTMTRLVTNATMNKKLSPPIDTSSYCAYFRSTAGASLNHHEAVRLPNEREVNVMPLMPVLTHDWYNFDLLYLIEKNEISTNLENFTYFSHISNTLRKIELIDFGIGTINFNAFRNFPQLQIIRLRNNNLNTVELSSFLTWSDDHSNYTGDDEDENNSENNDSISSSSSNSNEHSHKLNNALSHSATETAKLIELDLSTNKLYNIKLENFVYLKSLRVLNLSNNYIHHFDLHFLSVVMPHLQVLDLSNNQIKRLRVIDNRIYFTSPSLLLDTSNSPTTASTTQSYISLVSNLILNELVYLNVEQNALSQLDHLFSISFTLIDDTRFCNLSNSLMVTNHRPILDMNLRNNRWKCDCKTYELIESLKNIIQSNNSDNISCYLNYLVRENSYIFANIVNLTESNFNCFWKKTSYSWSSWYEEKCRSSNKSILIYKSNQTASSVTVKTNGNHPAMISFKIDSLYSLGSAQNNRNLLTTRMSLLKYDITNLFYWISSICLSVVTISCLLLAWYYCWKRYQGQSAHAVAAVTSSSAVTSPTQSTSSYSRRELCNSSSSATMAATMNHLAAPTRRSDVYLLNSRLNRVAPATGAGTSVSPYLYQISLNRNTRDEIVRGDRIRSGITATSNNVSRHNGNNNLYYISLNPDSSFRGGSASSAFINVGYQSSSRGDPDEPPNYYEAILVSSSTGVGSSTTHHTSSSSSPPNSRTSLPSGLNSLNKSHASPNHRPNAVDDTASSSTSSSDAGRGGGGDGEVIESAHQHRQPAVTVEDDLTQITQTTSTNDDSNTNQEDTITREEPPTTSGIDLFDVTLNEDDDSTTAENTSTTFFIDRNLMNSRRGRSTDV